MKIRKIGIFGGSFDPVHKGHIALAENAMREYKLDTVFFVPAKQPPHKPGRILTSPKHRSKMLKLAFGKTSSFKLNLFELRNRGTTYTYETVKYFKNRFPKQELFFIIGSDSLNDLESWKNPEMLLSTCTVLTGYRKGVKINSKFKNRVKFIMSRIPGISSTEIRTKSKNIKKLVPGKVYSYIKTNNLYEPRPSKNKVKG